MAYRTILVQTRNGGRNRTVLAGAKRPAGTLRLRQDTGRR